MWGDENRKSEARGNVLLSGKVLPCFVIGMPVSVHQKAELKDAVELPERNIPVPDTAPSP
jgi:hypothetical protein